MQKAKLRTICIKQKQQMITAVFDASKPSIVIYCQHQESQRIFKSTIRYQTIPRCLSAFCNSLEQIFGWFYKQSVHEKSAVNFQIDPINSKLKFRTTLMTATNELIKDFYGYLDTIAFGKAHQQNEITVNTLKNRIEQMNMNIIDIAKNQKEQFEQIRNTNNYDLICFQKQITENFKKILQTKQASSERNFQFQSTQNTDVSNSSQSLNVWKNTHEIIKQADFSRQINEVKDNKQSQNSSDKQKEKINKVKQNSSHKQEEKTIFVNNARQVKKNNKGSSKVIVPLPEKEYAKDNKKNVNSHIQLLGCHNNIHPFLENIPSYHNQEIQFKEVKESQVEDKQKKNQQQNNIQQEQKQQRCNLNYKVDVDKDKSLYNIPKSFSVSKIIKQNEEEQISKKGFKKNKKSNIIIKNQKEHNFIVLGQNQQKIKKSIEKAIEAGRFVAAQLDLTTKEKKIFAIGIIDPKEAQYINGKIRELKKKDVDISTQFKKIATKIAFIQFKQNWVRSYSFGNLHKSIKIQSGKIKSDITMVLLIPKDQSDVCTFDKVDYKGNSLYFKLKDSQNDIKMIIPLDFKGIKIQESIDQLKNYIPFIYVYDQMEFTFLCQQVDE